MQGRVQFSLRHFGLLALATIAATAACEKGPLTDDEMTRLRDFTLAADPPADTSNMFAGDLKAAQLGKLLFFDGRYSGPLQAPYNAGWKINGALGAAGASGTVSCSACHDPASGGADTRSRPVATSLGSAYTGRNAPTVINAAYSLHWQFWDGRADSLWSQALGPPEGGAECNSNRLKVVHFLHDHDDYRTKYEEVFGLGSLDDVPSFPAEGMPGKTPGCQSGDATEPAGDAYDCIQDDAVYAEINTIYANFGKAIGAYERLLVSTAFKPSPFDDFMAGNSEAMSPAAVRGARLFVGRAGCAECHTGHTFTDFDFHNIGAPQAGEYARPVDDGRYGGLGALTANMFNRKGDFSDDKTDTAYLQELMGDAPVSLKGKFKTPSLRNVAKTAPYMHDGVYATLWDVVNHYNFGGVTGNYEGERDPAIAPLLLTDAELGDLVEFLRALDDGPSLPNPDFPEGLDAPPPSLPP
jgi:cytochrome c peroxidase